MLTRGNGRDVVFITAIVGALYESDCDALRLAQNLEMVCRFIVAVREGWTAQDRNPASLIDRCLGSVTAKTQSNC